MLLELAVRDLGVVAELRLVLGSGMTALTGETGAGKTMIVEAIGLLLGAKPDPARVRPGATEAVVEGLFVTDDGEMVIRRVVPANGRARSAVDGSLATAAQLAEIGSGLVELHGQHAQQALLRPRDQRRALDRFGSIDCAAHQEAVAEVRRLEAERERLAGDERSRHRELDLLHHQLAELDSAGLCDPEEEELLAARESVLADVEAHRSTAAEVSALLRDDEGALDLLARAARVLDGREAYREWRDRLLDSTAEIADAVEGIRSAAEQVEDDPGGLEAIRERRGALGALRRKYGDTLGEVMAYAAEAHARADELSGFEDRLVGIDVELLDATVGRDELAESLRSQRSVAAPELADAVVQRLAGVGLGGARVEVRVAGRAGEEVEILLAANPGLPLGPLTRVASGGELSRVMLALHLVLSTGPGTMVFDEVDAGIGGATGGLVGRSLSELAGDRQILVVTHLPQVAAFADAQVAVRKQANGDMTATEVIVLDGPGRVEEIGRMLSGSSTGPSRAAAEELLGAAGRGGGPR